MESTYWQRQTADTPLFEDIVWNKPVQKSLAGKLLIVGGNLHAVTAPVEAYETATKQGIGECRIIMPGAAKKLFGPKSPAEIEFAPSTISGSFSTGAIDDVKTRLSWANAVLFAGDVGRNSETAILLERLSECGGLQIYTQEAADYFTETPDTLLKRTDTMLVLSFAQLQKHAQKAHFNKPFTFGMDLTRLVEILHDFTTGLAATIVVEHQRQIIVANAGRVVTTKVPPEPVIWRVKTAAACAVWWLQNPSKPLEAAATAVAQM